MDDDTKPEEIIVQARKRFDIAVEATAANRVFQLDDVKFAAGSPDNGWQWPEQIRHARMNDPNGPRPVLTNNVLPQHIRQVTNEQRQNRPVGKVLPVDDQGDPEVAEVLNGVVRHIQVRSHADVAYDTACECQVTSGEGYWRILTEYCDEMAFDQDILIDAIRNPFSVYMDPDGLRRDSTGRKCEWGFITDYLPNESYKAQFPDAKSKAEWDNLGIGDNTKFRWFDDQGVTIAEYFSYSDMKQTLCLWSDGSATVKEKDYAPPEGIALIKERETTIRKVIWRKINGIEVLEKREWAGKYIPIIRVAGNEWEVEGKMVVSGLVRNGKDPQRMLNYWTSQEAEMLALAPKAPFIGAAGQFENFEDKWRDANIVNYAYIEYNATEVNGHLVPPPQRQPPPQIPVGYINAKLGAADDVKAVTGQYDPSLGKNPQSKSGIALQREQVKSEVGTFHYVDNLSRAIGFSTEQIIDLIPKIMDTKRIVRIIGEDNEPDNAQIDPEQSQAVVKVQDEQGAIQKIYNPSVGKYDVVVVVGPSFTTKRQEAAELLTQLSQSAKDPVTSQIITYLAIKANDMAGADEAADMLKNMLPPQALKTDDETDPENQKAQLQAAVQALGQREAQLQEHTAQLEQASQQIEEEQAQAQQATQKANDAYARAEAKANELNAIQEDIKNQLQLLDMKKQLALKESQISSITLKSEKAVVEAEVATLQARMDAKLAEINNAADGRDEEQTAQKQVADLVADLQKKIEDVANIAKADRELIYDDAGEPIGSRTVLQ